MYALRIGHVFGFLGDQAETHKLKETFKMGQMVLRPLAAAVLAMVAGMGTAHAVQFDVGNPDVAIRWDNTIRYNYVHRVESQNQQLLAEANDDDGNRNFNKGMVSNRIDILTDFDFVYRENTGFRLSGAAWYDDAYRRLDNTSLATSNHFEGGAQSLGLGPVTKRYYRGPSGELLDAFIFGGFKAGDVPVHFKLGRHTQFWGEALLSPIHGISYAQGSLDLRKAAAVPGVEAKELFMPRNALSAQAELTSTLSVAAQYFLGWNQVRYPEAGSFLAAADVLGDASESILAGPLGVFMRGQDVKPKKTGDFGISTRWRPAGLDGTLGFYYRKTADIQPQLYSVVGPPAAGSPFPFAPVSFHNVYHSGIKIFGASFATNVSSMSLGAELSYRKDMPLLVSSAGILSVSPLTGDLSAGPRGDTAHGVVNLMGSLPSTPIFDAANWIAELQWSTWTKVSQGYAAFAGNEANTGIDKATKNALAMSVVFTPTWFGVLPGVDLMMPTSFSTGLHGVSAVGGGGYQRAGSYSLGLAADAYSKYRFDLSYVDAFGPYRYVPGVGPGTGITSNSGPNSLTKDRGFVSFTFKTTF